MAELSKQLEKLPQILEEYRERYRVPGAALAVLSGDEVFETASGLLNKATGVSATTDSVFQIGSITKVFTTTLMMQLVEEGKVNLDTPVHEYLPEFRLADPHAWQTITVRQLLTHTSGMDGDFFLDTGRGDDCVERFVLACAALPQVHAPGEGWSYCNAGFAVAGRIIELFRGKTWDRVMREYLLDPIGNQSMGTLPEEALLQRAAVGHVIPAGERAPVPASVWALQRSNGPAGATPFGTAADLLRFARLHIAKGVTQDGARLISEESVAEMQRAQVELPLHGTVVAWGLGWMIFDWGGERVIGHDGGTIGQNSYLRLLPERGIAVALVTNGGVTQALYRRIFDHVLSELAGVHLPELPQENPEHGLDLGKYVGTYERLSQRIEITLEDGVLMERSFSLNPAAEHVAIEQPAAHLLPIDAQMMVRTFPDSKFRDTVTFMNLDAEGRPGGYFMSRLHPRVMYD